MSTNQEYSTTVRNYPIRINLSIFDSTLTAMGENEEMNPRHVTDETLNTNLEARMAYDLAFLNFTPEDGEEINKIQPILAPAIPNMVDDVYRHLTSFDVTAKAFIVPQSGSTEKDQNTEATVRELSLEHPNIKLRRNFLGGYLVKFVGNHDWTPQSRFWDYLDKVGLMHTGKPAFKHREKRPELHVDVHHCSLLLGVVLDMVLREITASDQIDDTDKVQALRALNKLIWIQNDLFQRHYVTKR